MSIDAMKQALEALEIATTPLAKDRQEVLRAQAALRAAIEQTNAGEASDGYHTFNELYAFRKAYNAALFNELAANGKCSVHKSWRHYDGELCFGGGWFIVVAMLPSGQISNHYEAKDWDLFKVPAAERAMFPFDGHTGADVVARLSSYAPAQTPIEQAQPQTVPAESGLAEKVPVKYTLLEQTLMEVWDEMPHADYQKEMEQEPVAWANPKWLNPKTRHWTNDTILSKPIEGWIPLYTAPHQWQGLTEQEIKDCEKQAMVNGSLPFEQRSFFARAIETKLREKNT